MNAKVKKKWLAALRSGKYRQAKKSLRNGRGYCCLGVLSDLYIKEQKTRWGTKKATVCGDDGLISEEIMQWAGLNCSNPIVKDVGLADTLANCNDLRSMGFIQIADVIEKSL